MYTLLLESTRYVYIRKLIESTGYDYIHKHKNALLEEIKSKDPQTVWDVLFYTKKVIEDRANQEDFKPIRNYALKYGIDLETIIDSMAIEFRNYSLPENGFPANIYE